ncbi:MAG: fold metallo-hydrolase [Chthonomonadales bacterium]|nr:fold metallo-hydrolase [Chthonomonadales bacterium]
MNRRELLTTAAGLSALFTVESLLTRTSAFASPRFEDFDPQTPGPLSTVKLTDHLAVIMGDGGNIAVLTGDEGTLQVDSGYANQAADLTKAIGELTAQPVTTLINTHWHLDHVGGNEAVGKGGARIIAQKSTRARMATDQTIEFMNMHTPPSPAIALPVITFAENLTLYANGEEIAMTHVAPAHTDTDIVVYFRKANVLHAGDLLFNGFYPFIDYSSKGWIGGMVAGLDLILKFSNATTKIIPGHGPMATKAEVAAFRTMLHTIQTRVEPMVKSGKTAAQVVAAKPTKDFDAKWGGGFLKPDQFATLAYTGIARHRGIPVHA